MCGHLDIVKYLHDAGADVIIQDWVWIYIYTLMISMETQH